MIGKTISHYKIIDKLGEGGMGVVYKAQDTKLDRTVALKFLPAHAISNEEDKERFIREAKAAASLNHHNIAHIYEIDETESPESGKLMFIAMEYVEGNTLEKIIHSKGGTPLPLKTAISYTIQIAEGLQVAHEKGIVHRDIKTANIMANDRDQIKIMDFGLAKVSGATKVTRLGTTMGTAAYMSPEQASGDKVDHRTDIWSLGVVMYEMICGQLPFKNDYEQALLYSIMNEEPEPLTAKRTGVPISLDGIIAKALAKDPAMRYQHVDEIPADLRTVELKSGGVTTKISSQTRLYNAPAQKSQKFKAQLPWLITAAIALISVLLFLFVFNNKVNDNKESVTRLSIVISQDHQPIYTDDQILTFSPDGKYVAYIGSMNGFPQLFLREMSGYEITPIDGTQGAANPFFSPDGKWIAFFAGGKLKKISVNGGTPEILCDAQANRGGWWADNGNIIFAGDYSSGLTEISSNGANEKAITKLDLSKNERTHRWPQVLPGSKWVLYTIGDQASVNSYDNSKICLKSLVDDKSYILNVHGGMARYVEPGYLLIAREGNLYCTKFNPENPENTSPPITVLQNIDGNTASGISFFDISINGELVYIPGVENDDLIPSFVDMNGTVTPLKIDKGDYVDARVSPDGNRIALTMGKNVENDGDIWIFDIKSNSLNRFTFGPGNYGPVWSKDGKYIYYSSGVSGSEGIMIKSADGTSSPQRIFKSTITDYLQSVTPDSRYLIYNTFAGPTQGDIFALDLKNSYKVDTLMRTKNFEYGGAVSPDGKWFIYGSNESGDLLTYMKTFPDLQGKWQISTNGGLGPIWSPSGDKIYYLDQQYRIKVVPLQTKPSVVIGNPKMLFNAINVYLPSTPTNNYDITPDGKKIIMLFRSNQKKSQFDINVVTNWKKELKEKLGQ
jgi:serine/threonine protein kinase